MTRARQHASQILGLSLRAATAALALASVLPLMVVVTQPAEAQTYKNIHDFTGGQDGAFPYAGLTMDKAGNLYGTANKGGIGYGTVYKLTHKGSGWTLTPLYSFLSSGNGDGIYPEARVTFGPNGTLYGTTVGGGTYLEGTVFNLKPPARACTTALCPWTETVLYSFQQGTDGHNPWFGDLIFDKAGNIYGTTVYGGEFGYGTVYELMLSGGTWTESVLYNFSGGSDGGNPYAGLTFDTAGNLYGTTEAGGSSNLGTVFQLSPSGSGWAERVLYNFQGGTDGGNPYTGLIFDDLSGNLYGDTYAGGTVFELTLSGGIWTLKTLYIFSAGGGGPEGGTLAMDGAGNLYGTTQGLGAHNAGNVWELTPSGGGWTYKDLYDFEDGSDGGYPYGTLVFDAGGDLYGTTSTGGDLSCNNGNGCGVVWEITP